jgi:hypothetical protein
LRGGKGRGRWQCRRVAGRAPLRDDMRFFTGVREARDRLEQCRRTGNERLGARMRQCPQSAGRR